MLVGWRRVLASICLPQRYVLSLMTFLALANAYTMRVCLNVAITVMVKHKDNSTGGTEDPNACPAQSGPGGGDDNGGEFDWDEATQGLILSSFFWGYVITHIPGGLLAEKFGGKWTLSIGILSTAVFTLLTPVVARQGWGWLLALRILEGLGEGPTFPAMNVLLANWAPPHEKGLLGSFAFSGSLLGTVVGQALSGIVLSDTNNDWPRVFYLFGGVAVLWFILFSMFCFNDPQSHPFITEKEKKYIAKHMKGLDEDKPAIPWRAMATSVPFIGLIIAQVGHDWVFFTMVTDLPKYLADVLKFNIKSNGFLSALPYLVMFFTSILAGYLCDLIIRKKWMSVTVARKFFTTVASIGPAAGIIGASYAGCDNTLVIVLFTVAMGFMGAFYPGMKVNALDLSPNFAGITMAIVNGIGAFSGIITPYLVGVLTPDSTLLQWRTVFWISAGVAIGTNICFIFMASGKIQPWNELPETKRGAEDVIPTKEGLETTGEGDNGVKKVEPEVQSNGVKKEEKEDESGVKKEEKEEQSSGEKKEEETKDSNEVLSSTKELES